MGLLSMVDDAGEGGGVVAVVTVSVGFNPVPGRTWLFSWPVVPCRCFLGIAW